MTISRQEAIDRELTHYFTGRQCKAGHVSARKVSNGACEACAKAYAASYYQKRKQENPQGVRAAVNEAVKRHYQSHRAEILERKRRYYEQNSEAIKARVRKRRADQKAEQPSTSN